MATKTTKTKAEGKKSTAKSQADKAKSEQVETVKAEKKKSENPDQKWYIVNSYSGHEKKVANQIMQRVKVNALEDEITEVLVPTQNKIVVTGGKKKTVEDRIFPGYVLIKMVMNDNTWQLIRNTDGVTGFVGTEKKPTPLSETEVKGILAFTDIEQPTYESSFAIGDAVKIVDGPFKDFVGAVSEINEDKGQVRVLISVFGRETPVDLDFLKVNKL